MKCCEYGTSYKTYYDEVENEGQVYQGLQLKELLLEVQNTLMSDLWRCDKRQRSKRAKAISSKTS